MSSNPPARKPLKAQPRNTARRSKAERDALEKAEAERRRARAEAAAADAAAEASSRRAEYGLPSNDHRGGKWRGRGGLRNGRGGRGGFMGQNQPRDFSRPSQPQQSAGYGGFGGGMGHSSAGGPSGSSIKREPGLKQDIDGDIAMLGIPGLKRDPDDLGYISSDPDEVGMGPGMNIDHINLVSDDEEQGNASDASQDGRRKSTATPSSRRRRKVGGGEPIRLQRKVHKDRTAGVNTEASSAVSAALRKKAEETSKSGQAASFDEALTTVTRKAKTRSKDLEVVGDKRRWRGVWEDKDDAMPVNIKAEPVDDPVGLGLDPAALDVSPPASEHEDGPHEPDTTMGEAPEQLETETKAAVRTKLKHKRKAKGRPAMYQTAEEIREWEKRQEELGTLQQELGRIHIGTETDPAEASQSQADDLADRRQDAVYLFQLPTILPDLAEATVKKEPVSPTLGRNAKPAQPSGTASAEETVIKIEDGEFGTDYTGSRMRKLSLAPGCAGKLRVHKSGRATMTWGGTNMEMKMGVSPYFLQTAILTSLKPEAAKPRGDGAGSGSAAPAEYGGEAISFGQIRGKLVVLPAWSDILGERGLA